MTIVSDALDSVTLPALTSPDLTNLTGDARSEALTAWGIQFYVFSVVAHVRAVLRGLKVVATTGDFAPTFVLARHIFEWTAQVCYVAENLAQHVASHDWKAARELLDEVVIGGKWVKEHGHKYGSSPTAASLPDPLRLKHALKSYEAYLKQKYGTEGKDDYGLLSEYSHPNGACLLQYHDTGAGGEVSFVEPTSGSPLPDVNWCLVDLVKFLIELLRLSGEQTVRPGLGALATRLSGITSGKKRG
ncbi:MAG: hypothetical protein ABSD98_02970 [Candidatus Korobacteraceae bacterium]